MQTEMAQAAGQVFRQLNDADLKFGTIKNERGERIELSHGTFGALLHSPRRSVRKAAFHQYYRQYAAHGTRWPRRWAARCSATSTTPGPAITPAPWRRRCFPTACRCRCTTT